MCFKVKGVNDGNMEAGGFIPRTWNFLRTVALRATQPTHLRPGIHKHGVPEDLLWALEVSFVVRFMAAFVSQLVVLGFGSHVREILAQSSR